MTIKVFSIFLMLAGLVIGVSYFGLGFFIPLALFVGGNEFYDLFDPKPNTDWDQVNKDIEDHKKLSEKYYKDADEYKKAWRAFHSNGNDTLN